MICKYSVEPYSQKGVYFMFITSIYVFHVFMFKC